jgi:hypothetical protein
VSWPVVRRVLLVLAAMVAVGAGVVASALGYVAYADCLQEEISDCTGSALDEVMPYVLLAAVAVMVFVLLLVDLVGARRRSQSG